MSEEVKQPPKNYKEQLASIKADTARKQEEKKRDILSKKKAVFSNEWEDNWADDTIGLMSSEVFKRYKEIEDKSIGEALIGSYEEYPTMNSGSFGEKMAYNKGFYHGLLHVRNLRDKIWMNLLQKQKGASNGQNEKKGG